MMKGKQARTLGLVGSRAFEGQAWRSPGARAVDEAVWEGSVATIAQPPVRKPLPARLREAVRAAFAQRRDA